MGCQCQTSWLFLVIGKYKEVQVPWNLESSCLFCRPDKQVLFLNAVCALVSLSTGPLVHCLQPLSFPRSGEIPALNTTTHQTLINPSGYVQYVHKLPCPLCKIVLLLCYFSPASHIVNSWSSAPPSSISAQAAPVWFVKVTQCQDAGKWFYVSSPLAARSG